MISEIQEYSILFSTRINQKDKKWQDGSMKYYKINHKIEITNVEGNIVTSEFKKINFVIDNIYTVNKILIEVLSLDNCYNREISIKKEKDNGVVIKAGSRNILEKPETKPEVKKKLLKARMTPLKHVISKPTAMTKVNSTSDLEVKCENVNNERLTQAAIIAQNQSNIQQNNEQPNHQESSKSITDDTTKGLKFKVIDPIIKRIPPKSMNIYNN